MVAGLQMKSNEHFQNLFLSYLHHETHFCAATTDFNYEFSKCNATPLPAVKFPNWWAALLTRVDYLHLLSTFTVLISPRLEIGSAHPVFNVSYKKTGKVDNENCLYRGFRIGAVYSNLNVTKCILQLWIHNEIQSRLNSKHACYLWFLVLMTINRIFTLRSLWMWRTVVR